MLQTIILIVVSGAVGFFLACCFAINAINKARNEGYYDGENDGYILCLDDLDLLPRKLKEWFYERNKI